jgi:hypothetical protein
VPYKIHTVLTDNGIQFRLPPRYADGPTARFVTHMFEMRCQENGIEHRFTKINHPWTTDEVDQSHLRDPVLFLWLPMRERGKECQSALNIDPRWASKIDPALMSACAGSP